MKKNLLSFVILALVLVNIVLTSIMMISMLGTNKKTADLVSDIAAVLNLELGMDEEEEKVEIPMSQQEIWNLDGSMTIPLQSEAVVDEQGNVIGQKDHYIQFTVSFSLDTKGEGYKDYGGENITNYESMVEDAITKTVSAHTIDECRNDFESIREEILVSVQSLFDKEFIYKVAINEIKFQ